MSKGFRSMTWVLSLILIAAMATPAFAEKEYVSLSPKVRDMIASHGRPSKAVEPCYTLTNQQSAPAEYEWNIGYMGQPLTSRNKWAGKIKVKLEDLGVTAETLLSVTIPMIWDPNDSTGLGPTSGTPDLKVTLYPPDLAHNIPNDTLPPLAPAVVLPFATWQAQLSFPMSADGSARYYYITFTLPTPLVLPSPTIAWVVFEKEPDTTTAGLIVLQDNGPELGSPLVGGENTADWRPATSASRPRKWQDRTSVGIDWSMYYDVCVAEFSILACTPGTETDWETQGNGYERTNYTSATLSNLCGVTLNWSVKPGGNLSMMQPIIADGKVLIGGGDSLFCYDQASGVRVWAIGQFPYVVGDLRCSPTVANGYVYFPSGGGKGFTKLVLATGAVAWNIDVVTAGTDFWSPPVVNGGYVYFTSQEEGMLYKLDDATGAVADSLQLTGFADATPFNGLTSNGVKLWVGTADAVAAAGRIIQVDMASLTEDWNLENPGVKFWGIEPTGDTAFHPFVNEGFPGTFAYDDGVLYYHALVRSDEDDNKHYPQTGSVGAIDVATEDGTGEGILWVSNVNDALVAAPGSIPQPGTNWSGPALGPSMVYVTARGFYSTTREQDGISAYDRLLGGRVWHTGYTKVGVANGQTALDDIRSDVPATVFCKDGEPYLFTSHLGGLWRLVNGNTGELLWYRKFSSSVKGTAMTDDCMAVNLRRGPTGDTSGMLCVFKVGPNKPMLALDTQFVFRAVLYGSGMNTTNIVDAFHNSGCANLTISSYTAVNPPVTRVVDINPTLTSESELAQSRLSGYDAWVSVANKSKQRSIGIRGGWDTGEEQPNLTRHFAESNVSGAAVPLFLTVNTAPGVIPPAGTQSLSLNYDETGLNNNTGYTNYINIASDDPDYFPQDPTGVKSRPLGKPYITFQMFVGCPDAMDEITTGLGHLWVNNFGAEAGGGGSGYEGDDNFVLNGENTMHFDGGWALVVDSTRWAFDGCSIGWYPTRYAEWGPTLPCGVTVVKTNTYDSPLGVGADAVDEVVYNMIDLSSPFGNFTAFTRQCGGVLASVKRVGSHDPDFGDFVVTHINLQNEPGNLGGGITGAMKNVYFGTITDWDISTTDNVRSYNDGYVQEDNGSDDPGEGTWMCGHVRLDGNHVGAGGIGSGSAPIFMTADIGAYAGGNGPAAWEMFSSPATYCKSVDPTENSCAETDLASLWSCAYFPTIPDGESVDIYMAIYRVQLGVNGLKPVVPGAAGAEAVYREVTCRAKAFAGFGKGDVNCDGCVDLQDVVALGNIVDGVLDPTGTAAVYTADVNADNSWDNVDYDLLYDVVSGVQPASALANGWRF